MIATFNSKFGIGDIVYDIREIRRDFQAKCGLCAGSGKVTIIASDRRAECPACCGNGWAWDAEDKHNEYRPLTIGQVRITADSTGTKVQYMCNETGVGSGMVHDEASFFHSAEDANAECVRRDAVIKLEASK